MPLTLEQLIAPRTKEQIRSELLQALRGIGFVDHQGTGTGNVTAGGSPSGAFTIIAKIIAAGALGTATFQVSSDGGKTYSATQTVPSGGTFTVPSTGIVLTFANGPAGSGTSFAAGDTFTVKTAIPVFPTTSWQAGSVPLSLVENDAEALEDLDRLASSIAEGGFVEKAKGPWLDLVATNVYDLTRRDGIQTKGTVRLTDAASAGPFTIAVGQLFVTNVGGLRFTNTVGGTLTQGGTLDLMFAAESPGSAYNVGNNSITVLATPLPGVTVNNPGPGAGASWITQQGTDTETDAELRARCKGRWAELGAGATAAAYESFAKNAESTVKRVKVRASSTVPGKVEVILAGSAGTVTSQVQNVVQAALDKRTPLTVLSEAQSANNLPVSVAGTVHVNSANLATAQAQGEANLVALFAAIPIGGVVIAGSRILSRERIIRAIAAPEGVEDVNLTSPAADVAMTELQVATLTLGLSWVAV